MSKLVENQFNHNSCYIICDCGCEIMSFTDFKDYKGEHSYYLDIFGSITKKKNFKYATFEFKKKEDVYDFAKKLIAYGEYCLWQKYYDYDKYLFKDPRKCKECSWFEYKYDNDMFYVTIDKYQGKKLIWEVVLMKEKAKEFAEEIIKCIEGKNND